MIRNLFPHMELIFPKTIYENYMFCNLDRVEIDFFLMMSESKELSTWSVILKEWDESNGKGYVIEFGEVEIVSHERGKIATLKAWDVFGEIALLSDAHRSATVIATERTKIHALSKQEFLEFSERSGHNEEIQKEILRRIRENAAKNLVRS